MSLFEQAAREDIRYPSVKGSLTPAQLWNLPLVHATRVSLDSLAQGVAAELKACSTESFVPTSVSPTTTRLVNTLNLKLDVLKHIIKTKVEEEAARKAESIKAARRKELQGLLGDIQAAEEKGMKKEEVLKLLEELDK